MSSQNQGISSIFSLKEKGRDSFRESHGGEVLARIVVESVDDDLTDTVLEALNTVLQDGE